MILRLDAVRERLIAHIPVLSRIGNAADFADLVEKDRLPQVTPAAFVSFGGLIGGQADVAAGMFRQHYSEGVAVVLMDRFQSDPRGDQALRDMSPMVGDVIDAVAGWGPDDAVGVFQLAQADLVGAKNGVLVFQIDFQLNDQLRITR
ncbi:hypothetical protein D2V17_14210 [Aurantiacibacter xanthus]|uniref:DUF3168 domain-containing protein n=1 Tax=Aurantiacibacter xanthus TaxID=1784712 RepID=A0A3A1P5X4_9SPHN|nr:hypothetical protein [Aurantiacibacter xanthus]RIV82952.1 hypothetical protein D2V17_14210 [Aurantiacibacter xanthus]